MFALFFLGSFQLDGSRTAAAEGRKLGISEFYILKLINSYFKCKEFLSSNITSVKNRPDG